MSPIRQQRPISKMLSLRVCFIFLFVVGFVEFFGAGSSCAQPPAQKIRRLDGSMISTAEAEAFAKQALETQKVTGGKLR